MGHQLGHAVVMEQLIVTIYYLLIRKIDWRLQCGPLLVRDAQTSEDRCVLSWKLKPLQNLLTYAILAMLHRVANHGNFSNLTKTFPGSTSETFLYCFHFGPRRVAPNLLAETDTRGCTKMKLRVN